MGLPAIRASELRKVYRIGEVRNRYPTLRDAIASRLGALRRNRSEGPTVVAVDDVSFEVARGEILGIIGANGAGKSSLLKILSRITEPTSGRAEIRGRIGSLLEVGTGFHPELTGRENIFLNGAILGMSRSEIRSKFDEIVDFAEVHRFIDTAVKHYSSGMYLRLAFAVAAHLDPEILLVDEVLAVGDAAFQKKCLGKLGDVAASGRTILFVSHNMPAIQGLCERVLWLDDGRLIEDGRPHAVVSRYLQRGASSTSRRLWPDREAAPGNDRVRIRVAAVEWDEPEAGTPTVHTPFRLIFEYWNLRADVSLNLSLHVYNEAGTIVFNAVPATEQVWQGRPLPAGLFRDTCHIPGDLLNDGIHTVELLVVEDDVHVIHRQPDILTFEVRDTGVGRGAWYGRWVGAVRPRLAWTTELLEEEPTDAVARRGAP